MRNFLQGIYRVFTDIFKKMDADSRIEFEKKYIMVSLQRGGLFNWMICITSLNSFYLDYILHINNNTDPLYRKTLFTLHIVVFVLSICYIGVYRFLRNSEKYRYSNIAKAVILSDVFLALFIAILISLNSQRFTGNIDVYIVTTLAVAMIIPMYPKVVLWIYGLNHLFFIAGLELLSRSNIKILNQTNSSSTVLVACLLFLALYRYNVVNFMNEVRLRKDRQSFQKLFEINPFPILISRYADGMLLYISKKARVFYDIPEEQFDDINLRQLYNNTSDFEIIRLMLEKNGQIHDYKAEQKTLLGQSKFAIMNFEIIDYFDEKAILCGIADITEIKRIENELMVHASMDVLTGVLNRRVGMDAIRSRFEMSKLQWQEFSLCFFDVDNLKAVNDKFGHKEGDSLIIQVCNVIKEELSPKDIIFRYGGDEFVIMLDKKGEQVLNETCRKIRERFEMLNADCHKPYHINVSIGSFVHKPEMDMNIEQIIELVDKEMYKNKPTG